MEDEKILAYVCYGKDLNNLEFGSFNNVPKDASTAIVTLEMPTIQNGELVVNKFYHRKFHGVKLPVEAFLGAYSRNVPFTLLQQIKDEVKTGNNLMFIPNGNDYENYMWIDEKDSVYESREDFENSIKVFNDRYSSKLVTINPEEKLEEENMRYL